MPAAVPIPKRPVQASPPRSPSRPGTTDADFWKKIDNLFYSSVSHAERAFKTNTNINVVVVGIGVVLIASSILSSWLRGVDVFSVAFASIGVTSFVAVFFLNPQKAIHKSLGNLVQIQIAYRTFLSQFESLADYDRQEHEKGDRTLEDVKETNDALLKAGTEAIKLIQEYVV